MRWVTRGGSTRSVHAGAIRLVALASFQRQVQIAAVAAQGEALVHAGGIVVAVSLIGGADVGAELAKVRAFLQDDVDDAGDRVRAVLGGRAVAQHLDALDRGQGNGIDVGAGRAAPDGLLHVHQGLLVAALAVDQDQQLVRAEAAQGCGADDVGAVADEGGAEVERRIEVLQHLAQFLHPGRLHVLQVDQAHRHGGVERGLGLGARAQHDYLGRRFGFLGQRGRKSRHDRGSQQRAS